MGKKKFDKKDKIIREIGLPVDVSASVNDSLLEIKGQKGAVKLPLKQKNISVKVHSNKIIIESHSGAKKSKKLIGSLMAHIKNMIKGSTQNHIYILKICSGHFPMNVSISNNKIVIKNFLGEKFPRVLQLKEGADVKVEGDLIYVESANKEIAGQQSADIEQLMRRPGYDTRVFQDGIYIINKDGRELK